MKTKHACNLLLILTVSLLIPVIACFEKKEFTVTGKLAHAGFDGRMVYLFKPNDDLKTFSTIDSTLIVGDTFNFSGPVANPLTIYYIIIGKEGIDRIVHSPLMFVPEKGHIMIELNEDYEGTVSGAPESERLNLPLILSRSTNKTLKPLRDSIIQELLPRQVWDNSPIVRMHYEKLSNEVYHYLTSLQGTSLFDEALAIYGGHLEQEQLDELWKNAGPRLLNLMKANTEEMEQEGHAVIGQPFFELICEDIHGKEVRLSEFVGKGKVVLLDFWASWCGPCIAEIPTLKEVYKDYKDKGFEIISISIDGKKEKWQAAMEEQQMEWPQLLNAKDENNARKIYGFNGIPYTLLIDAEGIVLKKNLRGNMVKHELEKLLNK